MRARSVVDPDPHADPDPHHFGNLDLDPDLHPHQGDKLDPHQLKIMIRVRVKVVGRIRIRNTISQYGMST